MNPNAADNLHSDHCEMRSHEHGGRESDQERREAQDHSADRLGKADVTLHQPMVKQVQCLDDKKRDVRVRWSEDHDTIVSETTGRMRRATKIATHAAAITS